MTKIDIYLTKSVEQNASIYFEKSKKAKKKSEGANEALEKTKKKLELLRKEKEEIVDKKQDLEKKKQKKEWFEKYRWFYSSDNILVIGGRDATTNEIVIKKHTDKDDLVFHTDMPGSPFVVIKAGKEIPDNTKKEAAEFTATFSKAWKTGLTYADVYYINSEQVSKKAQAGEYLKKGAFMIYGKKNYLSPKINLAIGMYKGKVMSGPISAITKHCKDFFVIEQGEDKSSDVAKEINKKFNTDLDEIIRALPANCKIKKQ